MPSSEPSSAHSAAVDDPSRRAGWKGTRVKDIRHRELRPGGRAVVTFFEAAQEGGRPHPRLRTSLPPVTDPFEGSLWPADGATPPDTADAFSDWLETAWAWALQGPLSNIDRGLAPEGSERYYRNSIRVQRTARFFSEAGALLSASVVEAEQDAARFRLRQLEDRAYAGRIDFDDADTGT